MKEIQAFISPSRMATVLARLEAEGARDLAVTRVDALGALAGAEDDCLRSVRPDGEESSRLAKIEIVCAETDAERFVSVLREASGSGRNAGGRVFVVNVERALDLRAEAEEEPALLAEP